MNRLNTLYFLLAALWSSVLITGAYAATLASVNPATHPAIQPSQNIHSAQSAQDNSLTLQDILSAVLSKHPRILASHFQVQALKKDVEVARRSYWPLLSATAESRIGRENRSLAPRRSLSLDQVLWDNGATASQVKSAQARVQAASSNVVIARQDLFLRVIDAWQNLLAAVAKEHLINESRLILEDYQKLVQRRIKGLLSAPVELELIRERILQNQIQQSLAVTQRNLAVSKLEHISGLPNLQKRIHSTRLIPDTQQLFEFGQFLNTVDWDTIARQHESVQKAMQEQLVLEQRLAIQKAENWPQVFVRVEQPLGTSVSVSDTHPSLFLGLRYSPARGFSGSLKTTSLELQVLAQEQTVQAVIREVSQVLADEHTQFLDTNMQLVFLRDVVLVSDLIQESYQRQFQTGRKSWIDLLNALRDLTQHKLAATDARVAMIATMYRLQVRMGLLTGNH